MTNPQPLILAFEDKQPQIADSAFIAPGAAVIGDVVIGENSNIWFQVAIRGDVNSIRIGKDTNIQDGTICHVTWKTHALTIGDRVTVGHKAILHGCTLEDESFVGMGATVMDGAVVESGAMVAAGALVSPGKVVKSGELWAGVPAKPMRAMTDDEKAYMPWSAQHYVELAKRYK